MAYMNKAMLIGNVGKEPEVRQLPDGSKVCSFSLATTKVYNDRNGNKQEQTTWHNLSIFGKLVEVAEKYVHKGTSLFVCGEINCRQFQGKDGATRYINEIRVEELQLLGAPVKAESSPIPGAFPKRPTPVATRAPQPPVDDPQNDLPF